MKRHHLPLLFIILSLWSSANATKQAQSQKEAPSSQVNQVNSDGSFHFEWVNPQIRRKTLSQINKLIIASSCNFFLCLIAIARAWLKTQKGSKPWESSQCTECAPLDLLSRVRAKPPLPPPRWSLWFRIH
jgi:hypothetical protein